MRIELYMFDSIIRNKSFDMVISRNNYANRNTHQLSTRTMNRTFVFKIEIFLKLGIGKLSSI